MRKLLAVIAIALVAGLAGPGAASAHSGIGVDVGVYVPAGGGGGRSGSSGSGYASFSAGRLAYELVVSERGSRLAMELRVTNDGDEPYSVAHSDAQEHDFIVFDKRGHELWRWSTSAREKTGSQPSATLIKAHSDVVFKHELSGSAYKAIKDEAVVVTALLKDTPYTLTAAMPERVAKSGGNAIHGAIRIGSGHGHGSVYD